MKVEQSARSTRLFSPRFWRHFSLVVVFLAIAVLEVQHGRYTLETLRREKRRDSADIARRQHLEKASVLRAILENGRADASYLAGVPAIARFCDERGGSPVDSQAVHELALSFLSAHAHSDRLSIYDRRGIERYRAERNGEKVGAIPSERLRFDPDLILLDRASLMRDTSELLGLVIEPSRPDGPDGERRLLRYLARIRTGDTVHGYLELDLHAGDLLGDVRRMQPVEDARAFLIDESGAYLAHPDHEWEFGEKNAAGIKSELPQVAAGILSGRETILDGEGIFLSIAVFDRPLWRLVVHIPESAMERATQHIKQEMTWVIGSGVLFTLALAIWGVIFFRISVREFRLSEEQGYLERIARESEKYRALMEGAADMILIIDAGAGLVRETNAVARRVLGLFAPEDGRADIPLGKLVTGSNQRELERCLQRALDEAGKPVTMSEINLQAADGHSVSVDGMLAAIDLGDEQVVEVSMRDLTEKKRMERQLIVAERLSMVGRMTAGVAHEINNPLEGIGNYLALLERESTPPEKRAKYLENVRHGFHLIRDIVRDLSAIARPDPEQDTIDPATRRADLAQVVARAQALAGHGKLLGQVKIEKIGFEQPLMVCGDERRLEQVFINLLLNAGKAMDGVGHIRIIGRRIEAAGEETEIEVAVEDDGTGIPEENLARIFDPFFTTAPAGGGLGLFVTYGIVRAHGGSLTAENLDPHGARIVLRLPAAPADPTAPRGAVASERATRRVHLDRSTPPRQDPTETPR